MRTSRLVAALVLAASVASPALAAGGGGEDDDPGIHCRPKWEAINDPGDGPVPAIYVPTGGMECW